MIHQNPHEFAGTTVKIKAEVKHPQAPDFGGSDFRVEDYWDRVSGQSWMDCKGNPTCLVYALRTGCSDVLMPTDDEVLYGKIGSFGHLVHVSEIEQ